MQGGLQYDLRIVSAARFRGEINTHSGGLRGSEDKGANEDQGRIHRGDLFRMLIRLVEVDVQDGGFVEALRALYITRPSVFRDSVKRRLRKLESPK